MRIIPFDNSYPSQYVSQQKISNLDMLDKVEKSDVIAYAFLQVWDSNSATSQKYGVPSSSVGHLHFDDLWANLPAGLSLNMPPSKDFVRNHRQDPKLLFNKTVRQVVVI
ncbi:hypothetical protein [Candidatus Coxiella mudrowiae]|uniref:hypothetical protein n=1 Tax=Candidatus Coxiella mudrowiae TaxID=2054173 RepID=UPI0012FEF4FA|nr:hypothetical protein [Candidatus Coxiella mudrowiae]